MNQLEKLNEAIKNFSLIGGDSTPADYDDFRDVLLRCAGLFRRAGKAYEINFRDEGELVYRLRSDKSLEGFRVEKEINFPRRDSVVFLSVEDMDSFLLEAIERELLILIEEVKNEDFDSHIEPELNLLRPPALLAELEVEFQRWERYESPLLVAICKIQSEDLNWKEVGRELKHQLKMTDIIGYLSDIKIGAIFPGEERESPLFGKLKRSVKDRFGKKLNLKLIHVPNDCEQWSKLKKQVER